jgi:hypothetical protein
VWILSHFKGPGGGSTGLLSLTRTTVDTLNVSAAATCKKPVTLLTITPKDGPVKALGSLDTPRQLLLSYGYGFDTTTITVKGRDQNGADVSDDLKASSGSPGTVSSHHAYSVVTDISVTTNPSKKLTDSATLITSTAVNPNDYWASIPVCQPDQTAVASTIAGQLLNQNINNRLFNALITGARVPPP